MELPEDQIEILLGAYASGAFPMCDPSTGEIGFYTADPRALLPLDDRLHVPRSVAREIRRGRFAFRTDTDFAGVVAGCAAPRRGHGEDDRWLDERIARWVCGLHAAGHAHSIEAWATDDAGEEHLVGGVYGVSIGTAFFGESMFHRARPRRADGSRDPIDGTGASSAALVVLLRHLAACGYELFDAQMPNPHTERFGIELIPIELYGERLARATRQPDAWRLLEGGRGDGPL